MSDDTMLKFVTRPREMPDLREASERVADYQEIYADFSAAHGAAQAGRCSQCGVPFCQVHCPVSNNIPDWLKLVAQGRLEEAYHVSNFTNALPEICGRICPQDRLCESACVLEQSGHGTVTIGAIEKYITDTAFAKQWVQPIVPAREYDEHIGIIGAGPAGLAAAARLREYGYQVTIYDAHDRPGGLLIYGIPPFKLEKTAVRRRTDWLALSGVNFVLNCRIGKDKSFADVRAKHDAVLIAAGAYQAREIEDVPGHDLQNIVPALDYLIHSNRKDLGDKLPSGETFNAKGRDVMVIGGGDTAMDCVRTAIRQGAKSVKCLYRRDQKNMPGSAREVKNAQDEGVEFVWLTAPVKFQEKDGKINQVIACAMRLGDKDLDGRQMIASDTDAPSIILHADMVVTALGFVPEDLPKIFAEKKLPRHASGAIAVSYPQMMVRGLSGVFAAGDIARGSSLVVWAVREGQDAAIGIHQWLAEAMAEKSLIGG